MLALSLLGCSALFVPATSDPKEKLDQADQLLSVYRPIPARRLIDEAIEIYKQQGDTEMLCYAYLVSTDYYRYKGSDAYHNYKPEPTFFVEPVPPSSVFGVRTENVRTAHKLAEDTCNKVIADAIPASDHFKAVMAYGVLFQLYFRNYQKREACDALDGQLKQYNLGDTAKLDQQVPFNRSKFKSIAEVIEYDKKNLKCSEL